LLVCLFVSAEADIYLLLPTRDRELEPEAA